MAGDNGDNRSPNPTPKAKPASAWAPLRLFPVFRALWIAQFASNVGTWMQTVGAQWLLVDHSPLLVSLVQTASSLPIVMLALPAGAWADLVDRRRLLVGAQLAMFLAAAALAATTFLDATSPALILALTFALGCGNAVASPAWQAIQPDLVDRGLLPQAAALNGLNMNVARAVGPASADHRGRRRRGLGVRPQRRLVRRHRGGVAGGGPRSEPRRHRASDWSRRCGRAAATCGMR